MNNSEEYHRVRQKLKTQISWCDGSHPLIMEKRKQYLEKLKLWDAVHGFSIWDKDAQIKKELLLCREYYETKYGKL